jgi:hypothetical protein
MAQEHFIAENLIIIPKNAVLTSCPHSVISTEQKSFEEIGNK